MNFGTLHGYYSWLSPIGFYPSMASAILFTALSRARYKANKPSKDLHYEDWVDLGGEG